MKSLYLARKLRPQVARRAALKGGEGWRLSSWIPLRKRSLMKILAVQNIVVTKNYACGVSNRSMMCYRLELGCTICTKQTFSEPIGKRPTGQRWKAQVTKKITWSCSFTRALNPSFDSPCTFLLIYTVLVPVLKQKKGGKSIPWPTRVSVELVRLLSTASAGPTQETLQTNAEWQ